MSTSKLQSLGNKQPPDYFQRRFDLLLIPATVVTTYHAFFLWVVYHFGVITNVAYHWAVPFGLQFGALFLSMACGYVGVTRAAEQIRQYSLIGCTLLFIVTVSTPIYFWGGSNRSCFSPLLATISGVAVLVSRSTKVRWTLAGTCIFLFFVFSLTYKAITLNTESILFLPFGVTFTGVGTYDLLQTLSAISCMIVTVLISRKTTVTIFD
jgi:hypothetical protein